MGSWIKKRKKNIKETWYICFLYLPELGNYAVPARAKKNQFAKIS